MENPLQNRRDLESALESIIAPLNLRFSKSNTWILAGDSAASYSMNSTGFEGFSRPFWGIVPALAGGCSTTGIDPFISSAIEGLCCGVDPKHRDYWGDTFDYDQKFVEMAVLGLSLTLCPDLFWNRLTSVDRDNLALWLRSANTHLYPLSNWLFFRVLLNTGLLSVGYGGSRKQIDEDLEVLENYYKGDGWYSDGDSDQYDYYISFGMHFYGLLYAQIRHEEDPLRSQIYRERASLFAADLTGWFAPEGEAVAFGRSQTYRFAQCSFWAAAAYCGLDEEVEWLTPGVLKGLVLRHLRWWFKQPIFTETGLLTIGYAYPNLNMAEGYNAPGSPYWGLKSFLVLALGEESRFWQADEEDLPRILPEISLQKHPRMIVCREADSGDALFLNGGQFAGFDPRHNEHKYSKLVYSSRFAFSVPTGIKKLEDQGCDNSLIIRTREGLWLHRGKTYNHRFTEMAVSSDWSPREGLIVRTMQTWREGHIYRMHLIQTDEEIEFCEGGFSCPVDDSIQHQTVHTDHSWAVFEGKGLYSLIRAVPLTENKQEPLQEHGILIAAAPNSNLQYPRTTIPALIRRQEGGTCRTWGTELFAGPAPVRDDQFASPEDLTGAFPCHWLQDHDGEIFTN